MKPAADDRLVRVFDLAYECLRRKINGGRIRVENEASLQLQFAAILKSVGELLEVERDEFFAIELEKPVSLSNRSFGKSGSTKAKIDIYFSYTNASTKAVRSCAVEMKFFKKQNHREPNNRYDVFADIHNLENYGDVADQCFMVVGTDHDHYVIQQQYSVDTSDFDFREGANYAAGTEATYRTAKVYGARSRSAVRMRSPGIKRPEVFTSFASVLIEKMIPNQLIERTTSGAFRAPTVAAHRQRWKTYPTHKGNRQN